MCFTHEIFWGSFLFPFFSILHNFFYFFGNQGRLLGDFRNIFKECCTVFENFWELFWNVYTFWRENSIISEFSLIFSEYFPCFRVSATAKTYISRLKNDFLETASSKAHKFIKLSKSFWVCAFIILLTTMIMMIMQKGMNLFCTFGQKSVKKDFVGSSFGVEFAGGFSFLVVVLVKGCFPSVYDNWIKWF